MRDEMAAWFDLKHRVQEIEDGGLIVASGYKGDGLPKWLMPALDDCDVFVLNVKGIPLVDTLCIVRLDELMKLLRTNGG